MHRIFGKPRARGQTGAMVSGEILSPGTPAPDFALPSTIGGETALSDYRGQPVILVFYPADFTPVCTGQLQAMRDAWPEFQKRNAIVLGVNPAGITRHAAFAELYQFPFPLLSDPKGRIAAGYGAGDDDPAHPQRTVYVIRQDGRVALAERGLVPHTRIFAALDRP